MPPGEGTSIETLRAFIAVAETGSLSKAAARLDISQPSVSGQMKRLQNCIGGALLTKSANGTALTPIGHLALQQARRIIEAVDQLLAMSGSSVADRPVRVAVSTVLVPLLLRAGGFPKNENICLIADHCREIRKGLNEGYIDIGCGFATASGLSGLEDMAVARSVVPLAWVRSRSFVLSPGKSLPIIGLPDDDYMIRPLRRNETAFRFALQTDDMQARLEAVRAGLGFGAAPLAAVPSDLVVANEYYLPKLNPLEVYICGRPEFEVGKAKSIVSCLERAFRGGAVAAEKVGQSIGA